MIRTIQQYAVTCDHCARRVRRQAAEAFAAIPATWQYIDVHDCGLTGYTARRLCCPRCVRAWKKRK